MLPSNDLLWPQRQKLVLLRSIVGLEIEVYIQPLSILPDYRLKICLKYSKNCSNSLLPIQNVVNWIVFHWRRKLEGSELSIKLELLFCSPEHERPKGITFVDAIHQVSHALGVPDKPTLERRNPDLSATNRLNQATNTHVFQLLPSVDRPTHPQS